MALQCGVCGTKEKVEVVCQHCGKPLCETHRYYRRRDRVFTPPWYRSWRSLGHLLKGLCFWCKADDRFSAFHCEACSNKYHAWA